MAEPAKAVTLERTLKGASAAWVLYDLANTVYAATLTFIFAPHVAELFQSRSLQGIVNSASMVASALLIPVFASMADHTGRSRGYMIILTMACIIPMALFGFTTDAVMLMALFFVSNFAYNSAVVFYNSLLASVAADRHQGLVSGLGVGLGYFGTILTLFILKAIPEKIEYETLYPILAGIFLVFALPSFLFVRERRVVSREPFTLQLARDQARTLVTTLTTLPRHRQIMWFLLGNFFCTDVLNTAILFFGDFTQNAFFVNAGTPEKENWVPRIPLELFGFEFTSRRSLLIVAGLALNILAMVFGVTLGFMSDRFGSLKTMRFSAWCLVFGLLGAALWAGDNLTLYVIAICGFGPLGLAGIWTAGRKLLIEITPRERLGEFSGLHGIAMKLSVVGSSVFGIIDSLARNWSGSELTGLRAALAFQAVPLLLGIFCLYMMHPPKTAKLMGHTDDLSTT